MKSENINVPEETSKNFGKENKLSVFEETVKYFNGDETTASVFFDKYSFNKEETPLQVYTREAKSFGEVEFGYEKELTREQWLKLTPYGQKRHRPNDDISDREEAWRRILRLLYDQEICSGGSVTSSVGTPELSSISNCTVIDSPHDSIIGLNKRATEMQILAKRRCGVGMDLSTIRPKGAAVNNQSKISAGVTLWMGKYSNAINEVAQENRRGALLLSIHCKHPDVLDFIKSKEDLTKITGANISVKWTDEFYEALDSGGDWITTFPIETSVTDNVMDADGKSYNIIEIAKDLPYGTLFRLPVDINNEKVYVTKYKAKDIWDTFIKNGWLNAEPGGFLWTNIFNMSPNSVYPYLEPLTTNPCGEVDLAPNDSCRLIHKNLTKCVDNPYKVSSYINEEKLYSLAYENICLGDDIVDLEVSAIDRILESIEPLYMNTIILDDLDNDIKAYKLYCIYNDKEIDDEFILWLKFRDKGLKGRRCGCGLLGLGDMFAMLGVPYGDEETLTKVMKIIFKAELDAEYDLAIIRGPFPLWDKNLEYDLIGNTLKGKSPFYQWLYEEFPEETMRMYIYGRRNSSWSTVAPTGCLTGNTIINTTNGDIPIKELFEINDVDIERLKGLHDIWIPLKYDFFVKDIHNKEQKITKLYWNGMSKTKKISLIDEDIECTLNHKFLIKVDDKKAKWVEANKLLPGDKIIRVIFPEK